MGMVEKELKEKFEKNNIDSFFKALVFLLNAGYGDLEAFSNALYFFPNYRFELYFRCDIIDDHRNHEWRFNLYEVDLSDDAEHLKEYINFCLTNHMASGIPCNHLEFSIKEQSLRVFLREKIVKTKMKIYEDTEYDERDLPF